MPDKCKAIYQNGTFHPKHKIDLAEGTAVVLTVEIEAAAPQAASNVDEQLAALAGSLSLEDAELMRQAIAEAFEQAVAVCGVCKR